MASSLDQWEVFSLDPLHSSCISYGICNSKASNIARRPEVFSFEIQVVENWMRKFEFQLSLSTIWMLKIALKFSRPFSFDRGALASRRVSADPALRVRLRHRRSGRNYVRLDCGARHLTRSDMGDSKGWYAVEPGTHQPLERPLFFWTVLDNIHGGLSK